MKINVKMIKAIILFFLVANLLYVESKEQVKVTIYNP